MYDYVVLDKSNKDKRDKTATCQALPTTPTCSHLCPHWLADKRSPDYVAWRWLVDNRSPDYLPRRWLADKGLSCSMLIGWLDGSSLSRCWLVLRMVTWPRSEPIRTHYEESKCDNTRNEKIAVYFLFCHVLFASSLTNAVAVAVTYWNSNGSTVLPWVMLDARASECFRNGLHRSVLIFIDTFMSMRYAG